MRTTSEKEQVINSRTENKLSEQSARSYKVLVGRKRMSVITMNGETKSEVENKLSGKFAECVTML
tara:strand:+ start:19186 stop:19380 length:195 start_codon:yes stop_codon:yes gene_type:complete